MFRSVPALSLLAFLLSISPAYPLTVEEILALKKAGVSDETIQMLLEREHEDRSAAEHLGTCTTPDGRVIRSTGKRHWPLSLPESYQGQYPIGVYPFINLTPPKGEDRKSPLQNPNPYPLPEGEIPSPP